jgi:hypothetical protein
VSTVAWEVQSDPKWTSSLLESGHLVVADGEGSR